MRITRFNGSYEMVTGWHFRVWDYTRITFCFRKKCVERLLYVITVLQSVAFSCPATNSLTGVGLYTCTMKDSPPSHICVIIHICRKHHNTKDVNKVKFSQFIQTMTLEDFFAITILMVWVFENVTDPVQQWSYCVFSTFQGLSLYL